jgi:tRNA threonylcarbamoyladenosine biosynthesis protein TsaB
VIDSSSVRAGIAVLDGDRVVAETVHESGRGFDLAAAVRSLVDPRSVDRVAVATGPGSFTGLRVGASFAVGLALGRGVPLLGFSTLDLQRARATEPATGVCEAGRGRIYALTPIGERALIEAGEVSAHWPAAGWLRPDTAAALGTRLLAESEVLGFGEAAIAVVAAAPELDCARVSLEYMQSFRELRP